MKIEVNKKEVLRYLGYKNQDYNQQLDDLIDEMRREILEVSNYRYTYKIVDLVRDEEGRIRFIPEFDPTTSKMRSSRRTSPTPMFSSSTIIDNCLAFAVIAQTSCLQNTGE